MLRELVLLVQSDVLVAEEDYTTLAKLESCAEILSWTYLSCQQGKLILLSIGQLAQLNSFKLSADIWSVLSQPTAINTRLYSRQVTHTTCSFQEILLCTVCEESPVFWWLALRHWRIRCLIAEDLLGQAGVSERHDKLLNCRPTATDLSRAWLFRHSMRMPIVSPIIQRSGVPRVCISQSLHWWHHRQVIGSNRTTSLVRPAANTHVAIV